MDRACIYCAVADAIVEGLLVAGDTTAIKDSRTNLRTQEQSFLPEIRACRHLKILKLSHKKCFLRFLCNVETSWCGANNVGLPSIIMGDRDPDEFAAYLHTLVIKMDALGLPWTYETEGMKALKCCLKWPTATLKAITVELGPGRYLVAQVRATTLCVRELRGAPCSRVSHHFISQCGMM